MTLRPTDMLEIQTAIDEYERKFPRRPPPSAEVALAWRLGKREAMKRAARQTDADLGRGGEKKPTPEMAPSAPRLLPWAKGVLLVGWWSVLAVAVASVFFFGAIVGGFK